MIKPIRWILAAGVSLLTLTTTAQKNAGNKSRQIVLFLPLQLDSIYNAQGQYNYKRYEFPRQVSGPLEFYQGFMEALDSLKQRPGQIDVWVIDTRSSTTSLASQLLKDPVRKAAAWLVQGNAAESRSLADAAKTLQIPLININLPNDAGVQDNPFYFLCNPTLESQCESIYRHLQQYYALDEILLVKKKGNIEDRIWNHWKANDRNTRSVPLRYRTIQVSDSLSIEEFQAVLDSNKKTLLFGASLDEKFARNLAAISSDLIKMGYPLELMGMSTWDNIREFTTNRYPNLELTIPTPFYYPRTDEWSKRLQTRFQENNYGRPSDLYLRGYEMAWFLHPFLRSDAPSLLDALPGKKTGLFAEIDWQPSLDPQTFQLNYFENRKMYFIKRMEGNLRTVR